MTKSLRRRSPKIFPSALLALAVAAPLSGLGCGAELDPGADPAVERAQGEILGGWTITVATRRAQGLLNFGGCSASLIAPDWVVTARHCVNWTSPASNRFSIPRDNGILDARDAVQLYPLGSTDATLVKLAGATPATWPNVSHPIYTGTAASLVGKDVICYGQGATEYATPSGLKNAGIWKQVTKRVDHVNPDRTLVLLANNGTDIQAPGDSGGPCFYNNALVGESWRADSVQCTDTTTSDTCKATITKMEGVQVRSVSEYGPYIDAARAGRAAATWKPLTLLNGWTDAFAYESYTPASTLIGTTVYLRGGTYSGTTSTIAQLPVGQRPSTTVYLPVNIVGVRKGRIRITTDGMINAYNPTGFFPEVAALTYLDGVSFALSPQGRTAIPLQNGWLPYGTRGIAVNDEGGVIRLQGAISTTLNNTNMQPFVLPAGFRPSKDVYVTVDLYNGNKGRAYITPAGTVTLSPEVAGTLAQQFTSFEGVFFAKDALGGDPIDLYNSWYGQPYNTHPPKMRNSSGVVIFRGAIATSGTSPWAFYLPEKYRPSGIVSIETDMCNGAQGRIYIQPDGWGYIQARQNFSSATCFTSLEGVQYGL